MIWLTPREPRPKTFAKGAEVTAVRRRFTSATLVRPSLAGKSYNVEEGLIPAIVAFLERGPAHEETAAGEFQGERLCRLRQQRMLVGSFVGGFAINSSGDRQSRENDWKSCASWSLIGDLRSIGINYQPQMDRRTQIKKADRHICCPFVLHSPLFGPVHKFRLLSVFLLVFDPWHFLQVMNRRGLGAAFGRTPMVYQM